MAFLASHPSTAQTVVQLLAYRLRVLSGVVINLITDDVRTRVIKMLLQLGARCGRRDKSGIELAISLTHQEIADMIGATRQTVTTTLGELEREGELRINHHRIHLTGDAMLSHLGQPFRI